MADEDRKFNEEETIKLMKFLEQNPELLKSSNKNVRLQLKEQLRDCVWDRLSPKPKLEMQWTERLTSGQESQSESTHFSRFNAFTHHCASFR